MLESMNELYIIIDKTEEISITKYLTRIKHQFPILKKGYRLF